MSSPLISDADRLTMLQDMGEGVSIANGAESVDTYGIFSRRFIQIGDVESYYPTVLVATHEIPVESGVDAGVVRGDTLQVTAGGFTIIGVHADPDGDEGFTLLVLQEGDE